MIVYLARCQAAASRFKTETLDTNWCPAVRGVNVPADEVHAHTTWTVRGRASMWPLADQPLFCACAVSSRWPREAFSELARAAGLKRVALRFVGGYQRKGRRGLRCAGILCFAYSHGVSVGLSDSLSGLPLISWVGCRLPWHICLDHVWQQWKYVRRGSSCLWEQPRRPDERLRERTRSSWPSGGRAELQRPVGLASFLFR